MPPRAHNVELDQPRTLVFTHEALRELDDELKHRFDTTFFQFIGNFMEYVDEETGEVDAGAMALLDMRVINTCYRYALRYQNPNITQQEAEQILDEARVDFGDLINHLVEAHPYLQADEDEQENGAGEGNEETGEVTAESISSEATPSTNS